MENLTITQQQRSIGIEHLKLTRESLLAAVDGLSDVEWRFKPADGGWSIRDVVEHLAIIEGRIQGLIGNLALAPEAEAGRDDAAVDAFILERVPRRTKKFDAPAFVRPVGTWTPEEAVQHFVEARGNTFGLLDSAPCLRGRVLPHPAFGPWDGYQWILATAAHTARHTDQIREIKAEFGK